MGYFDIWFITLNPQMFWRYKAQGLTVLLWNGGFIEICFQIDPSKMFRKMCCFCCFVFYQLKFHSSNSIISVLSCLFFVKDLLTIILSVSPFLFEIRDHDFFFCTQSIYSCITSILPLDAFKKPSLTLCLQISWPIVILGFIHQCRMDSVSMNNRLKHEFFSYSIGIVHHTLHFCIT